MEPRILPTTVVGSYVQPDWLVDRNNLKGRLPPRVRAREIWKVPEESLEEAQDTATLAAIHDFERAGVDIVTDGEIRRESYSNRIATALGGIDIDNPGTAIDRTGHPNPVPRIAGPIRRTRPIEVRDAEFLVANTDRMTKITVPGPFTMTQQAQNDHYDSAEAAAMDYAAAMNEEIKALFAAGVDVVQLDEPYMQARPEIAKSYAVKAINRALEGVEGTTAVHLCFGYAHIVHERPSAYSFLPELENAAVDQVSIEAAQSGLDLAILERLPSKTVILGVLSLGDPEVETAETVAERIRRGLEVLPPERIVVAPDCGMKYLDRDTALGKLKAMVAGTDIVRKEIEGRTAGE
ncbi:MAG: 5-methyltetrahydropteroyltriglutamate--homocysteine methyltransferase [Defluviicoccus sp.]|nr:5-methyltetrahydropteroyltriglutamate--homocysteine methyltransferase [Defluviicoccus sp.]MDE0278237.1 5-methyltetrahydropteroyltriglutamate--homocysteine methyltransferase [Defluviicoccus sp.]